jgi:hypothetical protein
MVFSIKKIPDLKIVLDLGFLVNLIKYRKIQEQFFSGQQFLQDAHDL